MSYRLYWNCATLFCISIALFAADKKLPIDETSNELLDISVSAPLDKDQIKQELGSDLGDDIIVVRLTARPVSDKPVQLSLDDFLLVSAKDGQRSEPFEPGQIAGSDSLSVTPNGRKGLGDHGNRPSIGFGGIRNRWRRQFRQHSAAGCEGTGIARRKSESAAGRHQGKDYARKDDHGVNFGPAVFPRSG